MQVADYEIVLVKGSVSTNQCSLCTNKYWARLSITEHVRNVYKKNLAHNMVAKWALLAADNLEHGKVVANTTFMLLLLLALNDADNIKCSRSNVKYVNQVKKQADIGYGDKILSNLIYLSYHYVKTNKDFRKIGLDHK